MSHEIRTDILSSTQGKIIQALSKVFPYSGHQSEDPTTWRESVKAFQMLPPELHGQVLTIEILEHMDPYYMHMGLHSPSAVETEIYTWVKELGMQTNDKTKEIILTQMQEKLTNQETYFVPEMARELWKHQCEQMEVARPFSLRRAFIFHPANVQARMLAR